MLLERFHPPRDWPHGMVVLGLGLGLSSVLVIGGLGLRWPVLLGALTPPVVACGLWKRRQRLLTAAAVASGSLLDPWVLQRRMEALMAEPSRQTALRGHWQEICAELEAIRRLAASCVELDPTSAVPLLLLLEGWLDRIQGLAGRGAPNLADPMALCRAHLAHVHDEALLFAHNHPGLPVVLPVLPAVA